MRVHDTVVSTNDPSPYQRTVAKHAAVLVINFSHAKKLMTGVGLITDLAWFMRVCQLGGLSRFFACENLR